MSLLMLRLAPKFHSRRRTLWPGFDVSTWRARNTASSSLSWSAIFTWTPLRKTIWRAFLAHSLFNWSAHYSIFFRTRSWTASPSLGLAPLSSLKIPTSTLLTALRRMEPPPSTSPLLTMATPSSQLTRPIFLVCSSSSLFFWRH